LTVPLLLPLEMPMDPVAANTDFPISSVSSGKHDFIDPLEGETSIFGAINAATGLDAIYFDLLILSRSALYV
jgi:hypothetical protein